MMAIIANDVGAMEAAFMFYITEQTTGATPCTKPDKLQN
jgi:hypothetical protein